MWLLDSALIFPFTFIQQRSAAFTMWPALVLRVPRPATWIQHCGNHKQLHSGRAMSQALV